VTTVRVQPDPDTACSLISRHNLRLEALKQCSSRPTCSMSLTRKRMVTMVRTSSLTEAFRWLGYDTSVSAVKNVHNAMINRPDQLQSLVSGTTLQRKMHSRYIERRLPSEVEIVEVRQSAHRQEQAGESLQMPSLTNIGLTPTAGTFGIIKGVGRHEYSRSAPLCLNGLITLTLNRNHCAWQIMRRLLAEVVNIVTFATIIQTECSLRNYSARPI
jgi:hypothetical protein